MKILPPCGANLSAMDQRNAKAGAGILERNMITEYPLTKANRINLAKAFRNVTRRYIDRMRP